MSMVPVGLDVGNLGPQWVEPFGKDLCGFVEGGLSLGAGVVVLKTRTILSQFCASRLADKNVSS